MFIYNLYINKECGGRGWRRLTASEMNTDEIPITGEMKDFPATSGAAVGCMYVFERI